MSPDAFPLPVDFGEEPAPNPPPQPHPDDPGMFVKVISNLS